MIDVDVKKANNIKQNTILEETKTVAHAVIAALSERLKTGTEKVLIYCLP
jgi:hypothetical protein